MMRKLEAYMEQLAKQDLCVAFSGGVDSSLLLKIACSQAEKTGRRVYAVTFACTRPAIWKMRPAWRGRSARSTRFSA